MSVLQLVQELLQQYPKQVFWVTNVVMAVLYVRALYMLATKPKVIKNGVEKINYRFNNACLSFGLTCLVLKVAFELLGEVKLSLAFEIGDTFFFWAFLLSSLLNLAEHSITFRNTRKRMSLFMTVKALVTTVWKFIKSPQVLKKLSTILLKKSTRKAAFVVAVLTHEELYATVNLTVVLAVSTALVLTVHFLGSRKLPTEDLNIEG